MPDKKLVKELIAELRAEGYIVDETRKHPKVTKPGVRGLVFLCGTASDHRAIKNTLADLYREFGFRPANRA